MPTFPGSEDDNGMGHTIHLTVSALPATAQAAGSS